MKRSHEPIFWSLFGAGGVLSALLAPILIFITGIIAPIGVWMPPQALDYGFVDRIISSVDDVTPQHHRGLGLAGAR